MLIHYCFVIVAVVMLFFLLFAGVAVCYCVNSVVVKGVFVRTHLNVWFNCLFH